MNKFLLPILLLATIAGVSTQCSNATKSEAAETATSTNPYTGAEWKEISPKELKVNPFDFFNKGLSLSVAVADSTNAMTIGWGSLGNLWGFERYVVTVYVRPDRFTEHLMDKSDYFVVEALPEQYKKEIGYLGTASGRDEDKLKGTGLTVKYTENGTPYFDEGCILLECRKIYRAPMQQRGFGDVPQEMYPDGTPIHVEYIGEIVSCRVKE